MMTDNLGGDKTDPKDVCIPVFFAESQPFGQMCANHIAIEEGYLSAPLQK
jgi:hypothetical protein